MVDRSKKGAYLEKLFRIFTRNLVALSAQILHFENAAAQKLFDVQLLNWAVIKAYYIRYNIINSDFYCQVNGSDDI